MNFLANITSSATLQTPKNILVNTIRNASKKQSGSTRNTHPKVKPKRRGWKVQDGHEVTIGTMLATQLRLRFHPGLNVGVGRNCTLYAMVPGRVMVTCEKTDLNWDNNWVKFCYSHRENKNFYKKYYNVIPEKQHQNFVLVDQI